MKRPYFSPCVSKPGKSLAFAVTSTSATTLIFHICEGGPVLRKDWGLPHGR